MPDLYATITEVDPAIQERLADVIELRAADIQQKATLDLYLSVVPFPKNARVLEIGCGTGAICRVLAGINDVSEVIGVDPSSVFLQRARELSGGYPALSFQEGDARNLSFIDHYFDVVIFHTTLCHIPKSELALAEAYRVVRPGGWVSVFDGDYATTTVAVGEYDPLQVCAEMTIEMLVHDRWLVRRLPYMLRTAGFKVTGFRSHGYTENEAPGYTLTLIDRGADFLATAGRISIETAAHLKAEARYRVEQGTFFGHISYASVLAQRP